MLPTILAGVYDHTTTTEFSDGSTAGVNLFLLP